MDLNTILSAALAEAVRTALAPLEERLRTVEQAVAAAQLDLTERVRLIVADDATINDLVHDRIDTFLDNDDLMARIDIEEAVREAVENIDLTETIRETICEARITI